MLNERSVSIATEYWAKHFGCLPEELFASPFRIVTHAGELADYDGAFALFRNGGATASIPLSHADTLRPLLADLSRGCSPDEFAAALSGVAMAVIGPAYIGYASSVVPSPHPARALGVADAILLQALQQLCGAIEWEHGGSSVEQPASGVFVHDRLVALAGYEVWGDRIAHISAITHPDYRGRDFARSAVAHLADRAIRAGLLPQYRTLLSNRASIRVAEAVGFQQYATSMAVRLIPAE